MEVKIDHRDDRSIVRPRGRLDASAAPELEEALMEIITMGQTTILVDMGGVGYISSGGLRVLLGTFKRLKKVGGSLLLFSLDPNVYKIFKLAGFTSIFTICSDEAEALSMSQ